MQISSQRPFLTPCPSVLLGFMCGNTACVCDPLTQSNKPPTMETCPKNCGHRPADRPRHLVDWTSPPMMAHCCAIIPL